MKAETVGRAFALVCVGFVASAVAVVAPAAAVGYVLYELGKEKKADGGS